MRMVVVLPAPLADHAQALARRDVKGHVVHHHGLAVALAQVADVDQGALMQPIVADAGAFASLAATVPGAGVTPWPPPPST